MGAPSGQMTAPAVRELLADGPLAGDWGLDLGRSSIRLKTRVMGLVPVNGAFRRFSGVGIIWPDGRVGGTLTVAAASIDTGNGRRDKHLRSADFLDAGNHPDIIFTLDGHWPSGPGVAVTGTLTVRGQTRPLSFDVAASLPGNDEICLDAEVRVNRADFGLSWNPLGLTSVHNTLTIHATFTREEIR